MVNTKNSVISGNIQLFAEIVNDICSQLFLQNIATVSLSKTQLSIIKTLAVSGKKSASDLSLALHFSRPAVTQQVDNLEKLKLVIRKHDQKDRRSVNIALTSKGQKIVNDYDYFVLSRHESILNQFSQGERESFNRTIEKFIDKCLDNVDNLDVLCLNCGGRFQEHCKIQEHKHICRLE